MCFIAGSKNLLWLHCSSHWRGYQQISQSLQGRQSLGHGLGSQVYPQMEGWTWVRAAEWHKAIASLVFLSIHKNQWIAVHDKQHFCTSRIFIAVETCCHASAICAKTNTIWYILITHTIFPSLLKVPHACKPWKYSKNANPDPNPVHRILRSLNESLSSALNTLLLLSWLQDDIQVMEHESLSDREKYIGLHVSNLPGSYITELLPTHKPLNSGGNSTTPHCIKWFIVSVWSMGFALVPVTLRYNFHRWIISNVILTFAIRSRYALHHQRNPCAGDACSVHAQILFIAALSPLRYSAQNYGHWCPWLWKPTCWRLARGTITTTTPIARMSEAANRIAVDTILPTLISGRDKLWWNKGQSPESRI